MAFVRVAKSTEIAPGQIREIPLQGMTIAVANVGGQFHAISNTIAEDRWVKARCMETWLPAPGTAGASM